MEKILEETENVYKKVILSGRGSQTLLFMDCIYKEKL